MRYLKSYRLFEKKLPKVSIKDFFADKINWKIIEDIRDMAGDDLDEYGYIAYKIFLEDTANYKDLLIAYGTYDNDSNSIEDGVVFANGYLHQYLIEDNTTLVYKYVIIDRGNDRVFSEYPTESETDILSRLNHVYPNEKISIGQ